MEPVFIPGRAFIQYLNPEILALYGWRLDVHPQEVLDLAVRLTRYATLFSDRGIIMPASYLFEARILPDFLRSTAPLRSAGLLYYTSPTADLGRYVTKKRVEYLPELSLFPAYNRPETTIDLRGRPLLWIPRIRKSSSADIGVAWRHELDQPDGVWRPLLDRIAASESRSVSKLEAAINAVPDRLDGRAFIHRFALPLVPVGLEQAEDTTISMLISRAYLESYLAELDAFILSDTPLGALDCGLPALSRDRVLRTISYRAVDQVLSAIHISEHVQRSMGWSQLIELRDDFTFRWLRDIILAEMLRPRGLLELAVHRSGYAPLPETGRSPRGRHALADAITRLHHLQDRVGPIVDDLSKLTERFERSAVSSDESALSSEGTQLILPFTGASIMDQKAVFLIHGRDSKATDSMKNLLRAAGLTPVGWETAVGWTGSSSPFTLDVVSAAFSHVQAVVVLFTPDENVRLREQLLSADDPPYERQDARQARPNVLIEAGMAFALHKERTVLVQVGETRPISDLAGINFVRFDGSATSRTQLHARLRTGGCDVSNDIQDYLAIDFCYTK